MVAIAAYACKHWPLRFFFIIAETRKNKSFGTSLLLANRPMSPKIINGSFAAIFDNNDVLFEFAKKLSQFRYGENDCPGTNQ